MKRNSFICIVVVLLLTLVVPLGLFADELTQNLQSILIEDFDDPEGRQWTVVGSKFITEGRPRVTYANAWPDAVYGYRPENSDGLNVLAVNAGFTRKGYNYLEIFPVKEDQEGNIVPTELNLPGQVKMLDLWVWGSSYDYYLEVYVKDYKGIVHTLYVDDLHFTGWKNLSINIPNIIPQQGPHLTVGGFAKNLRLVKFVVWTTPTEKVDDFYIFLDRVKVLTDMFVSPFDGDELANPEKINEIWSSEEEAQ